MAGSRSRPLPRRARTHRNTKKLARVYFPAHRRERDADENQRDAGEVEPLRILAEEQRREPDAEGRHQVNGRTGARSGAEQVSLSIARSGIEFFHRLRAPPNELKLLGAETGEIGLRNPTFE